MHFEPSWRILTVGDGDLSYSAAIAKHHKVASITATTLDSETVIREKYQDHAIDDLRALDIEPVFSADITDPRTWRERLKKSFDLVIFQFPLIPAIGSKQDYESGLSINLRNRRLLHLFLSHSEKFLLDDTGAGIACISSKDVKPYTEWNLETAIAVHTGMNYVGKHPFELSAFPGYLIRNVDRDKHVKQTKSFSYFWRRAGTDGQLPFETQQFQPLTGDNCQLCLAGPFTTEQEKDGHMNSRKHKNMAKFAKDWQDYLYSQYNDNDKSSR